MFTLYKASEKAFTSNGLAILDDVVVSCKVERKINTLFCATLTFLICDKAKMIEKEMIIKLPTGDGLKEFRVVDIDVIDDVEIEVFCESLIYDLRNRFIKSCKVDNKNGAYTLLNFKNNLDKEVDFNFTSNISDNNSLFWVRKNGLDALVGNEVNSFINKYGGEIDINGWDISINKALGTNRGFTVSYGKNITGFNCTDTRENLITRIYPLGFDGINLGDEYVDSEIQDRYNDIYTRCIEFSDIKYKNSPNNYDKSGYETEEEYKEALREASKQYFLNSKCDIPTFNFDVSFLMLKDTIQYKDYAILEQCFTGDTVNVNYKPLNINIDTRVVGYVYDAITEMYDSIELGSARQGYLSVVDNKLNDYETKEESSNKLNEAIDKAFENIDDYIQSGGNNSFIRFIPNSINPTEILALDNENIADAINVVRINKNGIGLSNTGVNGTYQGITTNGKLAINELTSNMITANLMRTGILSSVDATSYINLDNGEFNFANKIKFINGKFSIELSEYATNDDVDNKIESATDNTIIKVSVMYAQGESEITSPTTGWQTTAPPFEKGKFIWSRTDTIYKNGDVDSSNPVCISGADGESGIDGVGIKKMIEYYYSSTSPTELENGSWITEAPLWVNGRYIWTKTVITYTDGSTVSTEPICTTGHHGTDGRDGIDGLDGLQGEKGEQGIPGKNGTDGIDGRTTYFHIKYSPVQNPTASQMTETPSTYIGTYVDYTSTDSTNPSNYTWSKFEGIDGVDGINGIPGKNGIDGKTSYLHIKYSNLANPTLDSQINDIGGDYIGQYTDFNLADSTNPKLYTWTQIKGNQGVAGTNGTNGITYYTWIKYATSSTGTDMSDSPTGRTYIGFAYNKTTATESTTASDYVWSLIKGEKGDTGVAGTNGTNGITYYTWIKYSDNSNGNPCYDLPTSNTKYIGIAINKTTASESSSYTSYTWSKFRGDNGTDGINGVDGAKGDKGDKGSTGATGSKGDKGDTGTNGIGVKNIIAEYYVSTSKTTQTGGEWITTSPSWSTGKYIWTRNKITYTDNSVVYTVPICDSSWEAINDIEIGGANIVRNGDFTNGTNYIDTVNFDKTGTNHKIKVVSGDTVSNWIIPGYNRLQISAFKNTERYGARMKFPGEANTNYIISGYIAAHRCDEVEICVRGKDGTQLMRKYFDPLSGGTKFSEWTRIEIPFKHDSAEPISVEFLITKQTIDVSYDAMLYLCQIKVEKGDKATAWTSNELDIKQQIEVVDTKYSDLKLEQDSISSKVSTIDTKVTTMNGTITNIDTRVKSAENKITSEAIYNTFVDELEKGIVTLNKNGITVEHNNVNSTTKMNADGFYILGEDGETIASLSSKESWTELKANKVFANNIETIYDGDANLYVNHRFIGNPQGTINNPFNSFTQLANHLQSNPIINKDINIYIDTVSGEITESLTLCGLKGTGIINITYDKMCIHRTGVNRGWCIAIDDIYNPIMIRGGRASYNSGDGAILCDNGDSHGMTFTDCRSVDVGYLNINCKHWGIKAIRSNVRGEKIDFCKTYCAYDFSSQSICSDSDSVGNTNDFFRLYTGSIFTYGDNGKGYRPQGNQIENSGKYILIGDERTPTNSFRTPPAIPPTSNYNKTFKNTSLATYLYKYGSWKTGEAKQGIYSSYGNKAGHIFFNLGDIRSFLSGGTVLEGNTITLTRRNGGGNSGATNIYINASSVSSASGTPSYAYNTLLGTLKWGETKTFTLSKSIVDRLKSGTSNSLACYSSSDSAYAEIVNASINLKVNK